MAPLRVFAKGDTLISEVYKLFLDLPDRMETCGLIAKDVKNAKRLVEERFDFVYGDAHGIAYVLDPRYCGRDMDASTRGNINTFLANWHGEDGSDEMLIELVKFHRIVSDLQSKSCARGICFRMADWRFTISGAR